MVVKLKPAAQRLVGELQTKLNLSDVDSRRAAFVVLSIAKGWKKARIARYLDVSRARVGQRVEKYQEYQQTGDWPELSKYNLDEKSDEGNSFNVSFSRKDWEDTDFADDLLNRLL